VGTVFLPFHQETSKKITRVDCMVTTLKGWIVGEVATVRPVTVHRHTLEIMTLRLCSHSRTTSDVTVAEFACTVDVMHWQNVTFVYSCRKTTALSGLWLLRRIIKHAPPSPPHSTFLL
jgi:hypothetical protein